VLGCATEELGHAAAEGGVGLRLSVVSSLVEETFDPFRRESVGRPDDC